MNLESDIKKSLACLYKDSNPNSIYVYGNSLLKRDSIIGILEYKLLKLINERKHRDVNR
jgi:hypothetical protein